MSAAKIRHFNISKNLYFNDEEEDDNEDKDDPDFFCEFRFKISI